MKCKDLFKNSDVEFVPAENNLCRQKNNLMSYATHHGYKIKIDCGLWINPSTQQCEKVLKITALGSMPESLYFRNRKEKIERIKRYIKQGLTLEQIGKNEGCTRQAISSFIKYHNIGD